MKSESAFFASTTSPITLSGKQASKSSTPVSAIFAAIVIQWYLLATAYSAQVLPRYMFACSSNKMIRVTNIPGLDKRIFSPYSFLSFLGRCLDLPLPNSEDTSFKVFISNLPRIGKHALQMRFEKLAEFFTFRPSIPSPSQYPQHPIQNLHDSLLLGKRRKWDFKIRKHSHLNIRHCVAQLLLGYATLRNPSRYRKRNFGSMFLKIG